MKKSLFVMMILTVALLLALGGTASAAGNTNAIVETNNVVAKQSTVYAGEISVDGVAQLRYLYAPSVTITSTVFDNLKASLDGTPFQSMVPAIVNETNAVNGFFRYTGNPQKGTKYLADTNYFGGISEDWTSAASVAGRCFTGAVGAVTSKNTATFDSVLSSDISSTWAIVDGQMVRQDTITFQVERTNVVYSAVNVTSPQSAKTNVTSQTVKESTVYAGSVFVDGASRLRYLYTGDMTGTSVGFENLRNALSGTPYAGMVPTVANEAEPVNGFFRYTGSAQKELPYAADTNVFGAVNGSWTSAAAVAGQYFTGTVGAERVGNVAALAADFGTEVAYNADGQSEGVQITGKLLENSYFYSTLSVTYAGSTWQMIDGVRTRIDTMVLNNEKTTIVYTAVNVTTQPQGLTVTLEPNGGTGAVITANVNAGGSYTLEACPFGAPAGKTFDGWLLTQDGKVYNPGQPFTVNTNLRFMAQWKDAGGNGGNGGNQGGDEGGGAGGGSGWDGGGYYVPQPAFRVKLAPIANGSALLVLTSGETGAEMNVYAHSTVRVSAVPDPGYTLDKIVWSLIDGSASYDITEAGSFVMPAMEVVVHVSFKPVA